MLAVVSRYMFSADTDTQANNVKLYYTGESW